MSRLTLAERIVIECGIYERLKLNEIAKKIGKSPESVSKEIRTNRTIVQGLHHFGKDCRFAGDCKTKGLCKKERCSRRCVSCIEGEKEMDNYTAIMKMNRKQLEMFLDDVYCTGLNNGMYVSEHPKNDDILAGFPYDEKWLSADVEPATLCPEGEEGDGYLTDIFIQSAIRNTGIDITETVSETKSTKSVRVTIKKK